jgi:uncharacterized protein with von Willebrand factor type A (vWA) domain
VAEKPEKQEFNGKDFHFVFVIDRSGSMAGDFIECAKKAVKLFL